MYKEITVLRIRKRLKRRGMYVVEYGERVGCFLVYISEEDLPKSYAFLCMPYPLETLYTGKKEIERALDQKIMRLVEVLPKNVYDVCAANFVYVKKEKEEAQCTQISLSTEATLNTECSTSPIKEEQITTNTGTQ